MDNEPKYTWRTAKATKETFLYGKKVEVECYAIGKSMAWSESDQACVSLAQCTKNKQGDTSQNSYKY